MSAVSLETQLATRRLVLRALTEADAPRIQECCSPREMARMMLRVPHPYSPEAAIEFIRGARTRWEKGEAYAFVGQELVGGRIVSCVGLDLAVEHHHAELGYWVAPECWGAGYATEAGSAMLRFGFERLKLRRVHAGFYTHNPASGRVLEKLGFRHEGVRPKHTYRLGEFVDVALMGILREDWEAMCKGGAGQ